MQNAYKPHVNNPKPTSVSLTKAPAALRSYKRDNYRSGMCVWHLTSVSSQNVIFWLKRKPYIPHSSVFFPCYDNFVRPRLNRETHLLLCPARPISEEAAEPLCCNWMEMGEEHSALSQCKHMLVSSAP